MQEQLQRLLAEQAENMAKAHAAELEQARANMLAQLDTARETMAEPQYSPPPEAEATPEDRMRTVVREEIAAYLQTTMAPPTPAVTAVPSVASIPSVASRDVYSRDFPARGYIPGNRR